MGSIGACLEGRYWVGGEGQNTVGSDARVELCRAAMAGETQRVGCAIDLARYAGGRLFRGMWGFRTRFPFWKASMAMFSRSFAFWGGMTGQRKYTKMIL